MKKFTFNDGDQYRPSTREWVNSNIDADYLKKHHCSSLIYGMDDIFGDYRIFTEDANFLANKTGKWTIVLYGKKMDELARVVVGGAKNCHWAKAAEVALKWLNDIMDKHDAALDAEKAREAEDALDEANDKMTDVVANYQPECDVLIAAANESHRKGYTYFNKEYLERIKALCDHVLEVCSVISQCNMVPDDGYYPDLSELYITADGISLDDEIALIASKLAA